MNNNPTKEERIARNKAWAKALKENPKKAKGRLRCSDGGRCCLGVAEDVAIRLGLKVEKSFPSAGIPSWKVCEFFGWEDDVHPDLVVNELGYKLSAIQVNDGLDLSHKKIAECVLNTFVRKKPTFKKVKQLCINVH